MRVHMPRRHHLEANENYYGILRQVSRHGKDLWEIKVTIPGRSNVDNMYLTLDDEEIERLENQINQIRSQSIKDTTTEEEK